MVHFVWLLLRNPVGIAHMWVIFYWRKLTRSWQRSSGICFVCRTLVTRIFFIKLNPTIGLNVGVGTNGTARNRPQLSCYFLDHWDIWGVGVRAVVSRRSQHSYYLPRDSWPSSVSLKYIILHQLPNPPPARNPNYQGSRCLTLTSGQPMYPNVGAKTLAATHTVRLQDPNPGPHSLQYTSYHYATTYLVRRF